MIRNVKYHVSSMFYKEDDGAGWFLADEDLGKLIVLAYSLVTVESDSWCAPPTALWTGEGLGWRWLECCSLFLPSVSFPCSFVPLCLQLTIGFSHCWAPTVSVWGLLLLWPTVDSCLYELSLQLVFVTLSWSTTIALSFLELAEENCFGHAYVLHPCDVASPARMSLKQDGLYARQADSLGDFFLWHVVLPVDAKDGAQSALVKPLK